MSMPGAGGGMKALRTLRRDDSVTSQPLSKGLLRRIFRFAAPYRKKLLLFLVLIIVDAAHRRRQPADLPGDHRRRDPPEATPASSSSWRCCSRCSPSSTPALLARGALDLVAHRPGPHLRHADPGLRPLPEDADRVLQPHPDRGADQPPEQRRPRTRRARSRTRCRRSSATLISVAVTLIAMFVLSLADHARGAACSCRSSSCRRRWMGRRIQAITRESYNLNAEMISMMTERFNVAGALLVKLFGQPGARDPQRSRRRPAASATSASRRRCTRASSWPRCC